jgi:hypothetical protein
MARVALSWSGRDWRRSRRGSFDERVCGVAPADGVDDVSVGILDRHPARGQGEAGRERLVCRLRARVARASEEEERSGSQRRAVGKRAERDVARPRPGPVDELPAREVGRRRAGVGDLDKLVAERALDPDRELVDPDDRIAARARDAVDLREAGAVVGDRYRARLPADGAAEAGEGIERGEPGARRPLRPLSTGRSRGPGGAAGPWAPRWFQASARSPERQAEAFATTRRAPPSTLRQAWTTPFLSGMAASATPASATAAIANATRIFERMLLLPSIGMRR